MTTQVTKTREISKVYPPNVLSLEIDSDHPKRLRALFIDSCNPLLNWADTQAQKRAYKKLDLMVVVDVTMTESTEFTPPPVPADGEWPRMSKAEISARPMLAYRGPIRKAPSRRIVSPFSIVFSRMCRTSAAYSSGLPRRCGNGTVAPSDC